MLQGGTMEKYTHDQCFAEKQSQHIKNKSSVYVFFLSCIKQEVMYKVMVVVAWGR